MKWLSTDCGACCRLPNLALQTLQWILITEKISHEILIVKFIAGFVEWRLLVVATKEAMEVDVMLFVDKTKVFLVQV